MYILLKLSAMEYMVTIARLRVNIVSKIFVRKRSNPMVLENCRFEYYLSRFPNKPLFYVFKSFENTVGNGEIARNEQFLLFPQCFPAFWRTFHLFFFSNLKLSSANSVSLKESTTIVVWEGVKESRERIYRYTGPCIIPDC